MEQGVLGVAGDSERYTCGTTWRVPGRPPTRAKRSGRGYLASPVDQVAATFEPWGIDHDDALTLAAMADATIGASYRRLPTIRTAR